MSIDPRIAVSFLVCSLGGAAVALGCGGAAAQDLLRPMEPGRRPTRPTARRTTAGRRTTASPCPGDQSQQEREAVAPGAERPSVDYFMSSACMGSNMLRS